MHFWWANKASAPDCPKHFIVLLNHHGSSGCLTTENFSTRKRCLDQCVQGVCTPQAEESLVTVWDCLVLSRSVDQHIIHVKAQKPHPFLHLEQHRIIPQVSIFANWLQLCNYEITAPNEIFGIGFEILSLPACLGDLCKCRKKKTKPNPFHPKSKDSVVLSTSSRTL